MFYSFVFSFLLLIAFIDLGFKINKKIRVAVFILLFLNFWLVAGLRYETGVDWSGYCNFFEQVGSLSEVLTNVQGLFFRYEFEFGYVLLNSFVRIFTDNVQWLFFIIAFITNILLFSSIRKYSKHVVVSLILYYGTIYFILDMSGVRQCIALNLFLYSLDSLFEKKLLKYTVLILCASLFHITSLILIPLYFIFNIQFKNIFLILFVSIGIIVSTFNISFIMEFINIFSNIFPIQSVVQKLIRYNAQSESRSYGLGFIFNLSIFIFCILKRKKLAENPMFNIFLNMYVLNLFFYYYAWEINVLSSRLRLYFSVGNVVLFSYFIDIYKSKINKVVVFIFIISFSFYSGRIYFLELPEGLAYNPYQNYISHEIFMLQSTGMERVDQFRNNF